MLFYLTRLYFWGFFGDLGYYTWGANMVQNNVTWGGREFEIEPPPSFEQPCIHYISLFFFHSENIMRCGTLFNFFRGKIHDLNINANDP